MGGIDAIVDIVGTCAALELLGVDDVRASPVATGMGMVRSAHGLLPEPCARGRRASARARRPTGSTSPSSSPRRPAPPSWPAIVDGWGPLPAMTITATGFGAGTRDLDDLPT